MTRFYALNQTPQNCRTKPPELQEKGALTTTKEIISSPLRICSMSRQKYVEDTQDENKIRNILNAATEWKLGKLPSRTGDADRNCPALASL